MSDLYKARFSDLDLRTNQMRISRNDNVHQHEHYFGGELSLKVHGLDEGVSLHPLFNFDLRDNNFDFLGYENLQQLPLIFPIGYECAQISYSVKECGVHVHAFDSTYDASSQPSDWPYENYPDYFAKTPVSVEKISYEEHKTFVFASIYTHYFSYLELLSDSDEALIQSTSFPFPQIGGIQFSRDNFIDAKCQNPDCSSQVPFLNMRVDREPMHLLAVVRNQPLEGISIWGSGGESVQIHFAICDICGSIYADSIIAG